MVPQIRPTPKQHEAYQKWWDDFTMFVLFGGGAGGGKSWWIAEKRLVTAYRYPESKAFIARKELKRLMASTYVTFNKVCKYHKIPPDDWHLNSKWNYIEFTNGSRIDLLDIAYQPSDPDYERFGSLEYTEGDMEEAAEAQFKAFDVLKTRVGRHLNKEFGLLGKVGLTCNPSKDWLYRVFYKPYRERALPKDYAFIQSLYKDNPFTAESYERQLSSITDKATKERLMFGNWEYEDDPNALMEYDAVLDLFTNSVDDGELYLIADVARYGRDKTVIGIWRGLKLVEVFVLSQQDTGQVAEFIRDKAGKFRIPYSRILIDEDGIGGGVIDQLRGVKGFVANSSPVKNEIDPQNYRNLKSQCSFYLADKVNRHEIAIETDDENLRQLIIEDLEQIKAKDIEKDGKLQVRPKEDVKEILGRSPDYGDMIMMRMFFELDSAIHTSWQYTPSV